MQRYQLTTAPGDENKYLHPTFGKLTEEQVLDLVSCFTDKDSSLVMEQTLLLQDMSTDIELTLRRMALELLDMRSSPQVIANSIPFLQIAEASDLQFGTQYRPTNEKLPFKEYLVTTISNVLDRLG